MELRLKNGLKVNTLQTYLKFAMFGEIFIFLIRDEVKGNLPKLVIIFSLNKTNFLSNNELFKKNLTQSKGNRITKLGRLSFTSSLRHN
jgi:hypothetical protein